jgi:hypothetical protein
LATAEAVVNFMFHRPDNHPERLAIRQSETNLVGALR